MTPSYQKTCDADDTSISLAISSISLRQTRQGNLAIQGRPSPSQDSRESFYFLSRVGGVRAASERARGTNTKKNNLTSRRRAANTQPYQPLPVVGLVCALLPSRCNVGKRLQTKKGWRPQVLSAYSAPLDAYRELRPHVTHPACDGRLTTTVMMMMRGKSRGRKEEENTAIEGRRSREGPKDAMQQRTNGGAQLEAEVLVERRRQANGQHDNQRSSGGQRCGCVKAQRRQLRCGGIQTGNTTTNQLRGGGGGYGRRLMLNSRR